MSRSKLNEMAVIEGKAFYIDQLTGYKVFTSTALRARGRCCGCACRHCPFEHNRVPMDRRPQTIKRPALLHGSLATLKSPVDILFFSGGDESILAARALRQEHGGDDRQLLLVTTFDSISRLVADQELPVSQVVQQAKTMCSTLIGVPLDSDEPYAETLEEAFSLIASANVEFGRVLSADLHLPDVREWRISDFVSLGLQHCSKANF